MEGIGESSDTVTVTTGEECLQAVMQKPETPAASPATAPPPLLPEIRLVLLGRKGAGKSAAGNTILGGMAGFESGKPTEECVKRRADVAGRRVVVVDTPGWEWYYPLNSTPDWVRRENLRSVSLCAPGPHAVLLVVRSCASVTEAFTSQIEEHLEPLGRDVWEHTLVLFTRGDELGLVSMEQRILTSGLALQNLLRKCGNRYHILDNSRSKGDATLQVQELMRKMEEMVKGRTEAGGGGGGLGYFAVDNLVLQGLEADGKRRARERRKKQRQMEAQTQRGIIKAALMSDGSHVSELDTRQSFSKGFRRLPEVRLVLLGERETGKSSAGNTILGGAHFFQRGTVTEECVRRQAEVAMRLVTVVDAPGWEGGVAGPTPERVKREIAGSVAMCPPGPHALLLTLRLDTLVKVGPVTENLELLGEGVWRHVVLLFTHGDQLREGVGIEQYIERGGRDLQWLLEKCRGRYHVISNAEVGGGSGGGSGGSAQVTALLEMVEKMAVGNRCEAFSGLVQEVSGLSQQRNEKFNQRLKEVGDKMLRQETELKKMREREVKSIRWFFDRKKKVKSPGKLAIGGVEKEDEEDEEERRSGEKTKNEMGDLEERMRWLTEDKEREIQDLNAEHDRILATLHQCTREKDDSILKLELKEREIEELLERVDEQQTKLLDLERLGSEKDRERKQRDGENRELKDEIENLSERAELQEKEKAELRKRVEDLQADMRESERHYEDIISQRESEDVRKERESRQKMVEVECKLKGEMERKLNEKEKELEDIKLEMKTMCQEKQADMESRLSEKDTEMKDMKLEMKKECQEMLAEMERKLNEKHKEMENIKLELKTMCQEKQAEMEGKLNEKEKEMEDIKLEMRTVCLEKQAEMERRLTEKDKEMQGIELVCQEKQAEMERRLTEKDKEMEDRTLEMKKEFQEMQADMERKLTEKHKEMEDMKLEMKTECQEMQEEMKRRQGEKDTEIEDLKFEAKRAFEERVEELTLQHRQEMERKREENEREIKVLKLQHEGELERKMKQMEKLIELKSVQHQEEMQGELRENAEVMEKVKQGHQAEISHIQQEAEREIKEMKQQHVDELETISQETSQLKQQHTIQLEETRREHEKERETIYLNYTTEITQQMKEKESDIIALKQQHSLQKEETRKENEIEKKEMTLNHEKAIANIIQEKEQEIVELKRQHVSVMGRELQEKGEKEQVVKVQNGKMEQILQDKERETIELKQHIEIIENNLRIMEERERLDANHRSELEQRIQEKEQEMKEKLRVVNEKEKNVKEQEMEVAQTRQQTDARETKWREEQSKRDERREEEIERLKQIIEENAQKRIQTQELVTRKDKELEEAAERCATHLKQLKVNNEINTSTIAEIRRHHAERERERDAEITQKLQEKEAELKNLNRRDSENEKEIAQLRQTIEQTKSELKELTGKMEKETTNMIGVYEREIASIKEDIDSTTQEKELAMSQLREVEENSRRRISDITDITKKYEESQGRVKELQEQNEKTAKEIEDLREYEKHERECEAQRSGRVGREEEITELLRRHEEQVKIKDSEIQNFLHERDLEVTALKRTNETLQREVERMKASKPKEEHRDRENDLRDTIKKLKTWEQSLERREAEVCKREQSQERDAVPRDSELCNGDYDTHVINTRKLHGAHGKCELMTAVNSPGSVGDVMYQEVGVVEEPDRKEEGARGTESDKRAQGPKEMADQRVETASSAAESNKCLPDTLGEMWSTEERGRKVEMKGSVSEIREQMERKRKGDKMEEGKAVRRDKLLSPRHDRSTVNSKKSELRVVMLRENRSSHNPVGVTILGREAPQADGPSSEPWRGQIAGRKVSVVEPPGLGWRNGLDPNDAAQRKNILDSISLSHPGPHALLLVIPTYLTLTPKYRKAVEDHVGLFGEQIWQRTLLLFTWGETLGESAEQHILRNGDLMALVEKCGGRYHMLTSRLNNPLIEGLFEKIEDMVALNNTEQC